MVTPDDIKGWITEKLPCDHIELDGDGQHFQAVIVSPAFSGKNMIQQHRLVYDALGTRMHAQIHALSMKTYTPGGGAARGGGARRGRGGGPRAGGGRGAGARKAA